MNIIKRIKVENIKGKQVFEITFSNFVANQPNIVVAPNGFGKSTIATAFKYAESGKMKVNTKDIFNQDFTRVSGDWFVRLSTYSNGEETFRKIDCHELIEGMF